MVLFRWFITLGSVFILCSTLLFAQSASSLQFDYIGAEQGMPQGTAMAIMQDSKGFIWIGTYDGLSRHDGYSFTNYRHNPKDSTTLPDNVVYVITEDKQGMLWVGTENGLARFNPRTEKFTMYKHDKKILKVFPKTWFLKLFATKKGACGLAHSRRDWHCTIPQPMILQILVQTPKIPKNCPPAMSSR
jgi:ligand-binding sensor domain-containing protein